MKQKILFIYLFLTLTGYGFAQATANQAPDIIQCANNVFDLSVQTPVILGTQPEPQFNVKYYTFLTGAQGNFGEIPNPANFVSNGYPQTIYARVNNTADNSFAMTTFQLKWNTTDLNWPDQYVCESYALAPLPPGYTYYNSTLAATVPAGTIITQTTGLWIKYESGDCIGQEDYGVNVGNPYIDGLTPLVSCDLNGDGFETFDLDSRIDEILNNHEQASGQFTITFYETQADAQAGANALVSPYTNVVSGTQTVYYRKAITAGDCFSVGQLVLSATACGTLSGTVHLDLDGNGCTADDPPLPNFPMRLLSNNNFSTIFTDNQGHYSVNALGTTSLQIVPGALGTNITYSGANIAAGNNNTFDFCISSPGGGVQDAGIYLIPITPAQPGFQAAYYILVQNLGNSVQSGTVGLFYPDNYVNFESATPAATSQVPGHLTFDFAGLQPGQIATFYVAFAIETPPIANAGDQLNYMIALNSSSPDGDDTNNEAVLHQLLVNSHDPNDISVNEGETITQEQVGDYLHYTVRFQNTGDADAVNVRIQNTLDPELDWETFRPVMGSHSYTTQRNGDLVTFKFDNINLPGSAVNEPASHGFISYEVKPIASLAIGDVMSNNANIYFDFNLPVATNAVTTQLIDLLGVEGHHFNNLKMYPNPASGSVTIEFGETLANDVNVGLYDIRGKKISESVSHNSVVQLDVSGVQSGLYFVKIVSDEASITKKLIVK